MTVTVKTLEIFKIRCNESRAPAKINQGFPWKKWTASNGRSAEKSFLQLPFLNAIKPTKTAINIWLTFNINATIWYNSTVATFSNINSNRKMIQMKIQESSYLSNFTNLVLQIFHNQHSLSIIIVIRAQLSSTKMKLTPLNSPRGITLKKIWKFHLSSILSSKKPLN